MTNISIPHPDFVAGNPINSSEMDANFAAITTFLNLTGVPVLQDGAVSTTAKLANGVVTHAKMDSKTMGQQVSGGYHQIVANKSETLNSGVSASAALSVTVTGDGITPVKLRMNALDIYCSNASGHAGVKVWDGTPGTGTVVDGVAEYLRIGESSGGIVVERTVPAFTGTKTFTASVFNNNLGTGAVIIMSATPTQPACLRATWAPGYSTS